MTLGYYPLHEDVIEPRWATKHSACFDLSVYLSNSTKITSYLPTNEKFELHCCSEVDNKKFIEIGPNSRVLVPTGLILDIPLNHSVRIHPRSGLSFKNGLVLANSEGIIDSDYKEELFVLITNISMHRQKIYHGDRIAQGELIKSLDYKIERCYDRPTRSERMGGFGSTGVSYENQNT